MIVPQVHLLLSLVVMTVTVPGAFVPIPLTMLLLPVLVVPATQQQWVVLMTPMLIGQLVAYLTMDGLLFRPAVARFAGRQRLATAGSVTRKELARDTGFY